MANDNDQLRSKFEKACAQASDINEHIDILRQYASQCSSVGEFGVRGGESTYGLLYGLSQSTKNDEGKKEYIGVDIQYCPISVEMSELAKSVDVKYTFIQSDSAKVNIPSVDLLFIDSWHVYGHLQRELNNNHTKVNEYIIMHDTTVDGALGESIRCGWNIAEQSRSSGYPEDEIAKGLWPAVEEFLQAHPEWVLVHRYTNNNGLTVLKRVNRV